MDRSVSAAPARGEALLLWAGLVAAFSPTIVDLVRHWIETPWSRYALVFPVLFAACAIREPRAAPRPAALGWVAAGLVLEVAAAFTGAMRWARPGLALAALGICRSSGFASPRAAVLLLFAVPAPAFAVHAGSALLDAALSEPIASFWRGAAGGGTVLGAAPAIHAHRGALALAPLLAGLAWYEAVLCRRPLSRALVASAAAALLAVLIVALGWFAAAGAAAAGFVSSAQWLTGPALWIPIAVTGIGVAEANRRRRAR